jgi:tetratricopeptide (TPR) repeat protein
MRNKINITYTCLFLLSLVLLACKTRESAIKSKSPDDAQMQALPTQTSNAETFIEANKLKILGNYTEASMLFEKCLLMNPLDDASMYELARIELINKNPEKALMLIEKATEISPQNDYYLELYANLLNSFDRYNDAIKVYKKLIARNPYNYDYYNQLAISYLLSGKSDEAIGVYNDLEEKIGINEEISLKKQGIYLQVNQINKAIEEVEKLCEQYPTESKYYAILAELCLANGYEDKALKAYQKIIEIDPNNPYIHISLADFYKKKGEEKKAFEELKTGFANPNLNIDSKIQILLSYYTVTKIYQDMKEEAMELSEILINTHPDDPKAFSMYGDFLYQDKNYTEAREVFRKVISIDSSKYVVWEQLLFTHSQLEDQESLFNDSKLVVELFPEQPLPYLFLGGGYYQKKQWDNCIEILNQGLALVVNNKLMEIQFYAYLGDAYNQLKNNEKSDEAYENVLKLDPNHDYVLNNYAYYLSLRSENLEKAAGMAKRATELKPDSPANQDTYGWVLYKMGKFEEARKWIEKALENEEEASAVIIEHYGDVLWQLGEHDEGYRYWIKARDKGIGSEFLEMKIEQKKLIE